MFAIGQRLTLQSSGDISLVGAIASGYQILADIGGNLLLQSLQDTHRFKSEDKSIGGNATAGLGFAGSAHIGQQKINSDYASVMVQIGLQAGDGGFQIQVGGQTRLIGAGIVSTPHAAHNTRSPLFNPNKMPEPFDAQQVYQNAVRGGWNKWYGKNAQGQIYRFSYDRNGSVHFSGTMEKADIPAFILRDWGMAK